MPQTQAAAPLWQIGDRKGGRENSRPPLMNTAAAEKYPPTVGIVVFSLFGEDSKKK